MRAGILRTLFASILGLVITAPSQADLITFTFTGTGNGALGAQSFTGAEFTITSTADTTQITNPLTGIYHVPDLSASVTVAGIGTGIFTIPTINVSNQNIPSAGISDPNANLAILFVSNPALATYSLNTSIGPVSGPTAFNSGHNFATTAGDFNLTAVRVATFEASVDTRAVPEPASIVLAGVGIVSSLAYSRRRKSRTGSSRHSS